jgi:hypothetical protein
MNECAAFFWRGMISRQGDRNSPRKMALRGEVARFLGVTTSPAVHRDYYDEDLPEFRRIPQGHSERTSPSLKEEQRMAGMIWRWQLFEA